MANFYPKYQNSVKQSDNGKNWEDLNQLGEIFIWFSGKVFWKALHVKFIQYSKSKSSQCRIIILIAKMVVFHFIRHLISFHLTKNISFYHTGNIPTRGDVPCWICSFLFFTTFQDHKVNAISDQHFIFISQYYCVIHIQEWRTYKWSPSNNSHWTKFSQLVLI